MAPPFNPADLEKLEKFIEFVSSYPLLLNDPQLAFVKKFVEQFGGTVPAGDFEMPAEGGKCPFAKEAKSESNSTPEPEEVPEAMEDNEDEESEESELELDMEETIVPFVEPNVLYLDVKPPKIVKNARKSIRKTRRRKSIDQANSKNQMPSSSSSVDVATIKNECNVEELAADDPLFTPNVEVKIEIEEGELDIKLDNKSLGELNKDLSINPKDKSYHNFNSDEYHNEDFNGKLEKDMSEKNSDYASSNEGSNENFDDKQEGNEDEEDYEDEDDDDIDDDELLIMLTKKKKAKRPRAVKCYETCKQKCSEKLSEEHRQRSCEYYWSLTKQQRVHFIQSHTKQKRFTRVKIFRLGVTPTRNNHCCYFLDSVIGCGESNELIRVCRKYFETTLCITSYNIQKALEGYTPEPADNIKPLTAEEKEERRKAVQKAVYEKKFMEVQEILDPETGVLHIFDPKDKKTKPPKKYKRRKPGDPMPKRDPKPVNCEIRCIYKCHLIFTAQDRKDICHNFWSMDYQRRKEFILAHIETKDVRSQVNPEYRLSNRPPRTYQTRFYLNVGLEGERKRVCKNFMMATLSITRHFISNALEFLDKNTGTYVGSDGRGKAAPKPRPKPEYWQRMKDHINTYPTWVPNSESHTRYLHSSLTIKLMFKDYEDLCKAQSKAIGSINTYYKIFHKEFDLSFLCCPERKRGIGLVLLNPNISQFIGNEPGGYWLHPSGKKMQVNTCGGSLDLSRSLMPAAEEDKTCAVEEKQSPLLSPASSSTTTAVDFSTASSNYAEWQFASTANRP